MVRFEFKCKICRKNEMIVPQKADDYETLMPSCGSDPELTKPFPLDRSSPRYVGDEKIRNDSRKKWMMRELMRASSNYAEVQSISITN